MNRRIAAFSGGRQRGAALAVVLMLLVVMALLGVASLRGTSMQQKMAANMYDRDIGFQAAEAALREAEASVLSVGTRNDFPTTAGCVAGLCSAPTGTAADRWNDSSFTAWANSSVSVGAIAGNAPQRIMESMGRAPAWPGCDRQSPIHPNCLAARYRITARSNAGAERALVILQSNVSTP